MTMDEFQSRYTKVEELEHGQAVLPQQGEINQAPW